MPSSVVGERCAACLGSDAVSGAAVAQDVFVSVNIPT